MTLTFNSCTDERSPCRKIHSISNNISSIVSSSTIKKNLNESTNYFLQSNKKFQASLPLINSSINTSFAPIEIAFVGRSNVGKSSLINELFAEKIAYSSNKPGHTKALNYYLLNPSMKQNKIKTKLSVIDLPGYGYAAVRSKKKGKMNQVIDDYIALRQLEQHNYIKEYGTDYLLYMKTPILKRIFVLIDSRHGFLSKDYEFIAFLEQYAVPYQIILTKIDKLKTEQVIEKQINKIKNDIIKLQSLNIIPYFHSVSTLKRKKMGIEQLRYDIYQLIYEYQ